MVMIELKEKIPFGGHPKLENTGNLVTTITKIAWHGQVTKGDMLKKLIETVKTLYDVDYVIPSSSGSISMYAVLEAWKKLNLKYGDPKPSVNIPAFTYHSVPEVAKMSGFNIVWEDINKYTWHSEMESEATLYTTMDTYGSLANNWRKHDDVIVDACQSFGIPHELRGIAEVFSLAGGKLISAGEGGLVLTNSLDLANEVEKTTKLLGRMPELSAATTLDYLKVLDEILKKKQNITMHYKRKLFPKFKFQRIPIKTNNYIVAATSDSREVLDKFPELIELGCRQYYNPPLCNELQSIYTASHHLCFPNGFNLDYEMATDRILEVLES